MSSPEQQYQFEGIDTTSDAAKSSLGPLVPFLEDPSVEFIIVNGPNQIYVGPDHSWERLRQANAHFEDLETLQAAIRFLIKRTSPNGSPYSEEVYPDDTRVTAILPPLVTDEPVILICKPRPFLTADDWVASGASSPEAIEFLKAAIVARMNILICGDMGSGKTTLLETLATLVPDDERIGVSGPLPLPVLKQEHVILLAPLSGRTTLRDIMYIVPTMRLDRLIVDEVAGREAKPLLESIAAGQASALFTISGSSTKTALAHLEACCLLENARLDRSDIRQLIISAVNLIVLVVHTPGVDSRVVITQISEIDRRGAFGNGYHQALTALQDSQDAIWIRDLFKRESSEMCDQGLKPTGTLPLCLTRIE